VDCGESLTFNDEPGIPSFSPFTFDLVISSQGTFGKFIGTSSGGTVGIATSTINIAWTPLQLGPGTLGAFGGDGSFDLAYFTINTPTGIVAPNSGQDIGQTTVQGAVASIPEPTTLSLIGGALIGLGVWRRKRLFSR
jgi:hypothetical protein